MGQLLVGWMGVLFKGLGALFGGLRPR